MTIVMVLIFLAIAIGAGYFWGRHTIQKDTERKEMDEDQLDKLHKLRG